MQSFKDKTKDGLKRELGVVYYLNVKLIMETGDIVEPDGGQWTKSFPFVKNISRFILMDTFTHFRLPPEFRAHAKDLIEGLLKDQKSEYKHERSGRWIQLWISTEPVIEYWPPDRKIITHV
jgi:hypothetical protein